VRCPMCGREFTNSMSFTKHLRCKHPLTDRCPVCGVEVPNPYGHMMALGRRKRSKLHWAMYTLYSKRRGKLKDMEEALEVVLNTDLWNFGVKGEGWEVRMFPEGFVVRRGRGCTFVPFSSLPSIKNVKSGWASFVYKRITLLLEAVANGGVSEVVVRMYDLFKKDELEVLMDVLEKLGLVGKEWRGKSKVEMLMVLEEFIGKIAKNKEKLLEMAKSP